MNLSSLPRLSRSRFQYRNSSVANHYTCSSLADSAEWKAVGWLPNAALPIQRPDDGIPPTDAWVGVLYENERGETMWCHHIVEAADLNETGEVRECL